MQRATKFLFIFSVIAVFSASAFADSMRTLDARAQSAANVLGEIATIPDKTIPNSLLKAATCIATIPHIVRAGFVFGGLGGKGLASCRVGNGWSEPSFVTISGGSWGLQIGIESMDLVLVFVSSNAIERLSGTQFTLGGDASIAVGPVGRDAQAGTDYQLNSEVFAYARTKGAFGGLTLGGNLFTTDTDSNAKVYGEGIGSRAILTNSGVDAPAAVMPFVSALMNYASIQ